MTQSFREQLLYRHFYNIHKTIVKRYWCASLAALGYARGYWEERGWEYRGWEFCNDEILDETIFVMFTRK